MMVSVYIGEVLLLRWWVCILERCSYDGVGVYRRGAPPEVVGVYIGEVLISSLQ